MSNHSNKKVYIKIAVLFTFLLLLTGCISSLIHTPQEEPQSTEITIDAPAIETVAEAPAPVPFSVFYAAGRITGAMYEPAMGAYLGAWLGPGMTKAAFEELADKKHAVFTIELNISDGFPTTWILQSIAAQAAPLIILRLPEEDEGDFPLVELAAFAHELGSFNLPAFVVFNPPNPGMEYEDYVLLFRYARILFRTYAPMAAFVWHGYDSSAAPESPFYPGHDVVDWVSLEALAPQGSEGFITDIPALLKPFYLSFQEHKPIILLPVGVGHFSRRDYIYRVPQAAEEIARIYSSLGDNFPRVRMVVYGNHGITTPQGDNFSLTREEAILRAYSEVIADSFFLSKLIPGEADGPLLMRSALHGYYYQGEVFIDLEILEARPHRPLPAAVKEIGGRMYVSTNDVNWMKVSADHIRQVIYIQ